MGNYSSFEKLLELLANQNKSLFIALIILIGLNIGVEIFRFFSMIVLSNKEKKTKIDLLKEEKKLEIIEKLFKTLDKLRLYDKTQSQEMLSEVKIINRFMSENKLYIPDKIRNISIDILDYFKNVMTDYPQKDLEKEEKLFNKFYNEFNN